MGLGQAINFFREAFVDLREPIVLYHCGLTGYYPPPEILAASRAQHTKLGARICASPSEIRSARIGGST